MKQILSLFRAALWLCALWILPGQAMSAIYGATFVGLSISTDGGVSFVNRTTADGLGDNDVNGVFAVGTTVYVATDGGLSISIDGGASFANRTTANGLGSNAVRGVFAYDVSIIPVLGPMGLVLMALLLAAFGSSGLRRQVR